MAWNRALKPGHQTIDLDAEGQCCDGSHHLPVVEPIDLDGDSPSFDSSKK